MSQCRYQLFILHKAHIPDKDGLLHPQTSFLLEVLRYLRPHLVVANIIHHPKKHGGWFGFGPELFGQDSQ
jgi:hypothetical protein